MEQKMSEEHARTQAGIRAARSEGSSVEHVLEEDADEVRVSERRCGGFAEEERASLCVPRWHRSADLEPSSLEPK